MYEQCLCLLVGSPCLSAAGPSELPRYWRTGQMAGVCSVWPTYLLKYLPSNITNHRTVLSRGSHIVTSRTARNPPTKFPRRKDKAVFPHPESPPKSGTLPCDSPHTECRMCCVQCVGMDAMVPRTNLSKEERASYHRASPSITTRLSWLTPSSAKHPPAPGDIDNEWSSSPSQGCPTPAYCIDV